MTQLGWEEDHRIRFFGDHGPPVITLHGGPGAYGGALRLAQGLSREFRVIEPWQRPSGDRPLTVAVHVKDLHDLIRSRYKGESPALVGASWGAMLDSGRKYLSETPWYSFSAGMAIFLVVLSLNLFGDGLRDALDPRLRGISG